MVSPVKRSRKKIASKKTVAISKKVQDYGSDPFFVKKAKAMETVLKKRGLPNSIAHA